MNENIEKQDIEFLHGDALEVLRSIQSESVQCCITSPPYWGLRDYQNSNQLGLEATYQEYIDKLVKVFDEFRRVLRSDGTCWVNIGDSYGGSKSGNKEDNKSAQYGTGKTVIGKHRPSSDILSKSLIGIPERFVVAMTDAGWIRRNTIIWHKPNCIPASVKDRFTVDFEYFYFFAKGKKYLFNQQFDEYTTPMNRWGGDKLKAAGTSIWDDGVGQKTYRNRNMRPNPNGRNKRSVWNISTKPFKGAHFAVYPPELIRTPILSCSNEGDTILDPFAGSGTTGMVAAQLNRKAILIDINEDYIDLQRERIKN